MNRPATNCGYVILGELGRGTTGVVYQALHPLPPGMKRRVALKMPFLSPEAERPLRATRFMRECQALACLTLERGTNIPSILEVGEHEGQPFQVRELIDGGTLEQRVAEGAIDLRAGFSILAGVAQVIGYVHSKGFAHRNLTAENVLVATDGTPRVIGFGRVGMLAGSDPFAIGAGVSPELDAQSLQGLMEWLGSALGQPLPTALAGLREPGAVATPGAFAAALGDYLEKAPPAGG